MTTADKGAAITASPETAGAPTESHPTGIWWTRRAVLLHLTIAILLPTFTGLFLWQVSRALSGNELSWAYVFEWPFFAGYAVFMWWRLVHEPPEVDPPPLSAEAAATAASAAPPAPETRARAAGEDAFDQTGATSSPVSEPARVGEFAVGEPAPPGGFYARWRQRREAAHAEQARREALELAAYNRYLAELHATGDRRQ